MVKKENIEIRPEVVPNNHTDILSNIKVNWKLNILIFVMALGALGIFLTALQGLLAFNQQQTIIYENVQFPLVKISQAEIDLAEIQTALVALRDVNILKSEQQHHMQSIRKAEERIKTTIDDYTTNWLSPLPLEFSLSVHQIRQDDIQQHLDNLQEKEIITFRRFSNEFTQSIDFIDTAFSSIEAGDPDLEAIQTALFSTSSARLDIKELVEINDDNISLLSEMSQITSQDVILRMILSALIALSFGLIVAYTIARSITKRLEMVQKTAISMERGYTGARIFASVAGSDEISSLANTLNTMFQQLQDALAGLEQRVQERTRDLVLANQESERRAKQFEAISLVSNAISSIRSLDELLPQIAQLISLEFGYYHIGIFLNDDQNEFAILKASNSEGGQRMLARGHKLRIGEQGIVGYTTGSGNPKVALDVGEEAVYFNNPDLPKTRSEIALPLKVGGVVIGALDAQSVEPGAFQEEDIRVLSLLAEQVSMALENARLFDQARKSLDEAETVYRQYIRQAWKRLPKDSGFSGIVYTPSGVSQIEKQSDWELPDPGNQDLKEQRMQLVSFPLEIRGENIGVINVQFPAENEPSQDQLDLIKAVADRVTISAENARLFDETIRRAERERLVSDITTKIRSSNNPEDMVHIALEELKTALGATQVQLLPHVLPNAEARKTKTSPLDTKGSGEYA